MASSKVDIWNRALKYVGNDEQIQSETEDSETRRVVESVYDEEIGPLLELEEWAFANRYALMDTSTETAPGWTYAYTMPADCLVPRRIVGPAPRSPFSYDPVSFEEGTNGTVSVLWTDYITDAGVWLQYTSSAVDPGRFYPSFRKSLVLGVAAGIFQPMRGVGDPGRLGLMAQVALDQAISSNHKHMQPSAQPQSGMDTARGGLE